MKISIQDACSKFELARSTEQLAYDITYLLDGCGRIISWISSIDKSGKIGLDFISERFDAMQALLEDGEKVLSYVGSGISNTDITSWSNPVNISNQFARERNWINDEHIANEINNHGLSLSGALLIIITEVNHLLLFARDIYNRREELNNNTGEVSSFIDSLQYKMTTQKQYLNIIDALSCTYNSLKLYYEQSIEE